MEYKYLGKTGMKVSRICLGTMQFGWTADKETSFKILDKAYDLGINFIDTANIYSRWSDKSYPGKSEEIIGEWMTEAKNREDIILATKVRGKMDIGKGLNDEGLSRRHILHQIKASLSRLQTDWIDLYQTHSPDNNTPIRETLEVLNDLIHQGRVHSIGISNYAPWMIVESFWIAEKFNLIPFRVFQPYYNLAERMPFEQLGQTILCERYGLGVIPYSPLAGGFLTGKYRKDQPLPDSERTERIKKKFMNEKGFALLEVLDRIAESKDATVAQISVAWLLHQPVVTSPIIGANTPEQLEETVGAIDINLTSEELETLNKASEWRN
ncbi:MAG: aldo/keto reductase [Candidatus Hodarchaeales archaeon]